MQHTLYFGAGRHSQGAGGRGQETAPGRLVPAGLYPWQGGERRPAMGDKRHMGLVHLWLCHLQEGLSVNSLICLDHFVKTHSDTDDFPKKSQANRHFFWNGIHTDYCHKWASPEIEMQSYMYTRFTHGQTNTHMWRILYIKCAAKQK